MYATQPERQAYRHDRRNIAGRAYWYVAQLDRAATETWNGCGFEPRHTSKRQYCRITQIKHLENERAKRFRRPGCGN